MASSPEPLVVGDVPWVKASGNDAPSAYFKDGQLLALDSTGLRAELERRVVAEGYKTADIFPELGAEG